MTLLVAKQDKKEIMYDLSSAFDLADHKILIPKLKVYGFDSNTLPHFRLLTYPHEKSVLIFEIPHSEIGADYEISKVQKAWRYSQKYQRSEKVQKEFALTFCLAILQFTKIFLKTFKRTSQKNFGDS